jgi:uncharacterized protein (DUF983 family)
MIRKCQTAVPERSAPLSSSSGVTLHCPVCLRGRGELICYASRQKHCVICQSEALETLELSGDLEPILTIEQIVDDPAASFWLKNALCEAITRDPVDAANDAEVLAQVLDQRCRKILRAA